MNAAAQEQEYAALLVNFYIYTPHNRPVDVAPLVEDVCQRLTLAPDPDLPDYMRCADTETTSTLLQWFFPFAPAAKDTWVVQLALEEQGTPAAVWPRLLKHADAIFKDEYAAYTAHALGYTLIYCAMLPPETAAADRCDELLQQGMIRRLGGASDPPPARIAQATLADGHLFLLAKPVGDGPQAATIYLALGALRPTDKHLRLMTEGLFGRNATLLMPDLIAHKSYAQQRALQRNFSTVSPGMAWQDVYYDQIEKLRSAVCTLLALHPAGEVALEESDLGPLIFAYEELVSRWIDLDGYYIVLEQQHHHYEWWQQMTGGGPVIAYHGEALRMAAKELEIQLQKGQHVLDVARTTVEIARAHLEKRRLQAEKEAEQRQLEAEQRRLQAEKEAEQRMAQHRELVWGIVAVIGTAMAIPQLVTWEVACGWLARFGWLTPTACADYLTPGPFIVQCVITLLVAVGFMVLVRWLLARQRIVAHSADRSAEHGVEHGVEHGAAARLHEARRQEGSDGDALPLH